MDKEMSIPELLNLSNALPERKAEDALVDYFENRVAEIENWISAEYDNRKHLIRAAFDAHRRQEYVLSIPVLLAQADGICKDFLDQLYFRKKDKKPCTAKYAEQFEVDSFMFAMLSPLAKTLPINASEYEREKGFTALNRHMVLHGESLDYGNKVNSLKAISLINYIAQVCFQIKNKKPQA